MRFLIRLLPTSGCPRESFLAVARAISRSLGASARNPKWTSRGALELDVFAGSPADLAVLLAALEPLSELQSVRDLNEPPRFMPRQETIDLARSYFNEERFWESHEALESLWRVSSGPEKELLQGMILVDAAFVHFQKGELKTALGLLKRAGRQLKWDGSDYCGIDVQRLVETVDEMVSQGRPYIFRI